MTNLNKVLLMGRLTRDPEQRFLSGGQSVVEFGLAINRKFSANGEKREETTFVDVTAWGKAGEVIHQYVAKGRSLFVEGRLKFDQWEKDGQKRSKLSVVLERFEFLPGGDQQQGGRLTPADFQQDQSAVDERNLPQGSGPNEEVPF